MPRPSCAMRSPFFQSPAYLPSAGHLIIARFCFSILSATSLDGALTFASVHSFCVSSWSRRVSCAWPRALNEAFITCAAFALTSASLGVVAHPTSQAAAPPSTVQAAIRVLFMGLSLDRGRVELGAVGVHREERGEVDRRLRPEHELRKALLAEAVVEAPLERAQLALRHAIRRPGRVR